MEVNNPDQPTENKDRLGELITEFLDLLLEWSIFLFLRSLIQVLLNDTHLSPHTSGGNHTNTLALSDQRTLEHHVGLVSKVDFFL